MTTGYNDDDDDDKHTDHPPPNARYPPHPHHNQPASHFTPMHVESEAKRKQDADTHHHSHPLQPLPRSLLPSPSPPPPYIDYKEEKQPLSPSHSSGHQQSPNPLPPHPFRPFFLQQWLDVYDTEGSWLEAQVVAVSEGGTHVKVHYKGYKAKYDEWLDASPNHPQAARIAPLHRHTRPKWPLPDWPVVPLTADGELAAVLPVQVDCLDTTEKWLPAHIIQYDTQHHYALVSYDGWKAEFNEWINMGSYRLAPPRTYTTTTSSKFVNVTNHLTADALYQHNHSLHPHSLPPPPPPSAIEPRYSASVDNETRFRAKLCTLGLGIVEQEQDGNCFPESDTRVLTNHGFLFLDEIEEKLSEGQEVLYGCYDTKERQLQYSTGKLVLPKQPPPYMVEFTEPNDSGRWAEGSGLYGDEKEQRGKRSHSVSLRVTPDHDMFVQTGSRLRSGRPSWDKTGGVETPHRKMSAQSLLSATGPDYIRTLASAENGYEPQDTTRRDAVRAVLGMCMTQFAAFLELLGFWLSDGSLQYHRSGHCTGVVFRRVKTTDLAWLKGMLGKAGLSEVDCVQYRHKNKLELLLVKQPEWSSFFDAEFGSKYQTSHYHTPPSHTRALPSAPTRLSSTVSCSCSSISPTPSTSSRSRSRANSAASTGDWNTVLCGGTTDDGTEEKEREVKVDDGHDGGQLDDSDQNERQDDVVDSTEEGELGEEDDETQPPLIKRSKSVKWLPDWMMAELSAAEMRRLIEGLHRADGFFSDGKQKEIMTSSAAFRDRLMQALLHCGYTASTRLMHRTGTIRGYVSHSQSNSCKNCSVNFFDGLSPTEQSAYRPVKATADSWKVSWTDMTTQSGRNSCKPTMSCRQCITRVPYSFERDGRIWCVNVDHDDHLIIAQRAQRNDNGIVTKQSRPIIVANCLFRSISHQLYDTGEHHRLVRETCMRYIDTEAAYFRAFVVGDFDAYVTRMCQPGEWGDHLEIQALSEVYDMPIEIYAYSTHPLRTYSHYEDGSSEAGSAVGVAGVRRPVMRLSYHFASHYNSVVEAGRVSGLLDGRHVGEVEEESMERRRRRREERERREREQREEEEDALQRSLRVSRSQFGQSSSVSEFDRAVAASLREMDAEEERKVEEVKRESEREAVERDEMELVMQQSVQDDMQHEIEQAELNSALQHSLATAPPLNTAAAAGASAAQLDSQHTSSTPTRDAEEEELRRAVQLSLQAAHPSAASSTAAATSVGGGGGSDGVYPPAVQKLLDLGFPLESCVSAYGVFEGGGESEEAMVESMVEWMLAQRS